MGACRSCLRNKIKTASAALGTHVNADPCCGNVVSYPPTYSFSFRFTHPTIHQYTDAFAFRSRRSLINTHTHTPSRREARASRDGTETRALNVAPTLYSVLFENSVHKHLANSRHTIVASSYFLLWKLNRKPFPVCEKKTINNSIFFSVR